MRLVRWLIPFVVLMLTLLACIATTPDDDDSSVPMSDSPQKNSSFMRLPTFTPSITPGPSPTPYPTTDPASFGPSTTPNSENGGDGISIIVVIGVVMVLLFGAFVAVIRVNPRRRKPKDVDAA